MNKKLSLLAVTIAAVSTLSFSSCSSAKETITFFNWGEYIGEDTLNEFEKETGIRVKMQTFNDNQNMLSKLENTNYDVVCPSDYAIEELYSKGKLEKLDKSKFVNYSESRLIPQFKANMAALANDTNKPFPILDYAIPYTWGETGILYDSSKISEATLEEKGWDIFLDPSYKVALYSESRDVYSMALTALGYDFVNPTSQQIQEADAWLRRMNLSKVAFVTDEINTEMADHKYDVVFIYSGQAFFCMQNETGNRSDLKFYIPDSVKDTVRTNIFTDALVITKNSQHKEAAYKFIDFMCRKDIATANMDYIGYVTPFSDVMDILTGSSNNAEDKESPYYGDFEDIADQYNLVPDSLDHFYRYNSELKETLENYFTRLRASA